MDLAGKVIVEFYGVPRLKAGRGELPVLPGPALSVLTQVEEACPQLKGILNGPQRLSPHYLISLDGVRFITDLTQELKAGDRLVILSADAGG